MSGNAPARRHSLHNGNDKFAAFSPFANVTGVVTIGRKCEYRLLSVNDRLCGFPEVDRMPGNGRSREHS